VHEIIEWRYIMNVIYAIVFATANILFFVWGYRQGTLRYLEQLDEVKARNEKLYDEKEKLGWEVAVLKVVNITLKDFKVVER
jgi:Tfp pilus assembly protein PilO